MNYRNCILATTLAMAAGLSLAQSTAPGADKPGDRRGEPGQGHRPPAEALAACKGMAAGAACSFTAPRGALSGTCEAPPDRPLACRPAHPGGGDKRGQRPAPPADKVKP